MPDSATSLRRAGTNRKVRARCLFPAPDRRPVRVGGRALAGDPPGKTTSFCASVRGVPRDTP